jgi:glutamate-1-semialdehyde 2,1-aminomutase
MSNSEQWFSQAKKTMPGGVNSPVRAFNAVGGSPIFFERGEGAYMFDADGKQYIDYMGSWGPLILGHCHPEVIGSVIETAQKGLSFGAPTHIEIELAEKVVELMPNIDQVRMVNSGTEATMTAIRLARGFTGRNKIVKFQGCYHGHSDGLLVKAGSGALTLGCPSSPGVPEDITKHTLNIEYNQVNDIHKVFAQYGEEIACVILEPVAGNMGCIPPSDTFLKSLRQACDNFGALLIFDEVMTGFRVSLQGAQGYYGMTPDITTLGKVIGGGMPVGAIGGKASIMNHLSPVGNVYQAGTLSGNPIAMSAGLATLTQCEKPGFYEFIGKQTQRLCQGLESLTKTYNIPATINWVPGMFSLFFTSQAQVTTFDEVMRSDTALFKKYYHGLLDQGVYFGPSPYEAAFISARHDDKLIDETLCKMDTVFKTL